MNYKIKGIRLLTLTEYNILKDLIPEGNAKCWMLDTPSRDENGNAVEDFITQVLPNGKVTAAPVRGKEEVRPVLIMDDIEKAGGKIGESLIFANFEWTIISNTMAICNDFIAVRQFNHNLGPKSNQYQHSDVKKYLDEWLKSAYEKEEEKKYQPIIINDYVLIPIKSAFDQKVTYWINKKGEKLALQILDPNNAAEFKASMNEQGIKKLIDQYEAVLTENKPADKTPQQQKTKEKDNKSEDNASQEHQNKSNNAIDAKAQEPKQNNAGDTKKQELKRKDRQQAAETKGPWYFISDDRRVFNKKALVIVSAATKSIATEKYRMRYAIRPDEVFSQHEWEALQEPLAPSDIIGSNKDGTLTLDDIDRITNCGWADDAWRIQLWQNTEDEVCDFADVMELKIPEKITTLKKAMQYLCIKYNVFFNSYGDIVKYQLTH